MATLGNRVMPMRPAMSDFMTRAVGGGGARHSSREAVFMNASTQSGRIQPGFNTGMSTRMFVTPGMRSGGMGPRGSR